jgi:hypothetical protein
MPRMCLVVKDCSIASSFPPHHRHCCRRLSMNSLPSLSVLTAAAMAMTTTMKVVEVTATKITVGTAMVGGTDNNQLKAAAGEMVAVAATATATERATVPAT